MLFQHFLCCSSTLLSCYAVLALSCAVPALCYAVPALCHAVPALYYLCSFIFLSFNCITDYIIYKLGVPMSLLFKILVSQNRNSRDLEFSERSEFNAQLSGSVQSGQCTVICITVQSGQVVFRVLPLKNGTHETRLQKVSGFAE